MNIHTYSTYDFPTFKLVLLYELWTQQWMRLVDCRPDTLYINVEVVKHKVHGYHHSKPHHHLTQEAASGAEGVPLSAG